MTPGTNVSLLPWLTYTSTDANAGNSVTFVFLQAADGKRLTARPETAIIASTASTPVNRVQLLMVDDASTTMTKMTVGSTQLPALATNTPRTEPIQISVTENSR